jgi:hypothetical protein
VALTGWLVAGAMEAAAGPRPQPVDYNREIRPILAKNCFACHGQDEAQRARKLRLDRREEATRELASGATAIVPGSVDESEVIARITEEDETLRMPPKKAGGRLSASEIETIRRWIEQGASYTEHWAFVRPQARPLPEVKDRSWPRNGIDFWVLARLEKEGLKPAPEADRFALLRRGSLDLRGLPPSPQELDAFASDPWPEAYERAVDHLLDDPAYGERWARLWLDLARYADSAGYGSDPLRTIWRYRDWVIDAYNRNLPYNRFTIEQIAGDLLPNASLEQRMATAFHRNTMTNSEGGTDDEEFRVAAIKDRVDSTMQIWMGLTMGCAKCHTHKYDPITQDEYYRFYAFFNQTADTDQPDEKPVIAAPTPEQREQVRRIDARITEVKRQLDVPRPELAALQAVWEAELRKPAAWVVLEPLNGRAESGANVEIMPDKSLRINGIMPEHDSYTVTARNELPGVTAYRLESVPDLFLPNGGAGRAEDGNFVLSRLRVEAAPGKDEGKAAERKPLALARAQADFTQEGFSVADVLDPADPTKGGWSVAPQQAKPHEAVFVAKEPLGVATPNVLTFRLDHRYKKPGYLLGRFRLSVTADPVVSRRSEVPGPILSILDSPAERRSPEQRETLARHYRSIAPVLRPIREEIVRLEKSRPEIPTLPVLAELPPEKRRETHVQVKGNFLAPGAKVETGVPASLHAFPPGAPRNRLGLALWLVDANNPLTARVAVNRYWAQFFGTGLVETEEDFGTQGEPPSHPELLDWLAAEYVRLGWDTKALLRLIVTSATYRQSSRVTPELLEKDPRNRLLTRGPRFRLEAEIVRDQALALSGLLSRKMYGPSVFPPQPDGLWQAAFNGQRTWAASRGEDRHRRGLYTFWRRTVPYPSMATFDAPSREICTVRRIRTNTPLQAFVTLNDPAYVEAAQALARRVVREGGATVEDRIKFALRLSLCRPPARGQVEGLAALYESERNHYRKHLEAARALATEPLGPLPPDMEPGELAAWTTVANVVLNLDGVLTKG